MWKKTDSKPRNYQKLSGWWEIKNEENNVQEKNHTMERPSYPLTDARPAGSSHEGPRWDTWVQLVRKAWKVHTRFSHFFLTGCWFISRQDFVRLLIWLMLWPKRTYFSSMFHFTLWVLLRQKLLSGRGFCSLYSFPLLHAFTYPLVQLISLNLIIHFMLIC